MERRDLSALLRFVLLTTSATAACGGLIEPTDEGSSSDEGDDVACYGDDCEDDVSGTSTSSSSGRPEPDTTSSASSSGWSGSSSSGASGSSSGSSGTSSGSGGGCRVGTVAFDADFCCPEGESCPNQPYGDGPDAGPTACEVDCTRVCAAIGVGTGGFLSCSWSGTSADLSYTCGGCGVGRVAAGTARHALGGTLGERLARQAYYEAASVTAFARLAAVLAAAEAPWDLVRRAQRAAEEEARHAATFATLAERHGATPCVPEPHDVTPTLFELAIENATEGCVRETFGALVTLHQAEHAESAEVRAAFASIADDELQHASLSWDLFAWFETRLGADEVAMMHDAYKIARRAAAREVIEAPDALGTAVGLPSSSRAHAMFEGLMRGLDSLRETRLAA